MMSSKEAKVLIAKIKPQLHERPTLYRKTKFRLMNYDPSKSHADNMKRLGVSSAALCQFLKHYKLSGIRLKAIQNAKKNIAKKWNREGTLQENAEVFCVGVNTARRYSSMYGLPYVTHRKAKVRSCQNKETITFLMHRGFTYNAIGRLFGTSRQRIQQIASGTGISWKYKRGCK